MAGGAGELETYIEQRLNPQLALHAGALARYVELVEQYSGTLNLTGVIGGRRLADELALEALQLLQFGAFSPGTRVADLGSGNGSPVVPLAVCCPQARFTAIESRQRRAAFLSTVKAALQLDSLTVEPRRVEDVIADAAGSFDAVTSRAFAQAAMMFHYAGQLLGRGGEVRGFSGVDIAGVERAAVKAGFQGFESTGYDAGLGQRHVWRAYI
jgi:16S rRNA (guanine527-N7)-methyltransferase